MQWILDTDHVSAILWNNQTDRIQYSKLNASTCICFPELAHSVSY